MRTKSLLALAAVAVLAWAVNSSRWLEAAQEPDVLRLGTRVALVDMTKVFEKHNVFQQKIEQMRVRVVEAEENLKAAKTRLEQTKAATEKLPIGSIERQEAQTKIDLDTRTMELDVNAQKAKFMQQEAQIYLETYESVLAIISDYAEEQKIGLVLRFNDSPIERADLQKVMQQLNKQVLYQKGADITQEILRRANAG
jgi:hypothetical protein